MTRRRSSTKEQRTQYVRVYGLVPGTPVRDAQLACPATVERTTPTAMLVLRYAFDVRVPRPWRGRLRRCDPIAASVRPWLGRESLLRMP